MKVVFWSFCAEYYYKAHAGNLWDIYDIYVTYKYMTYIYFLVITNYKDEDKLFLTMQSRPDSYGS